MPGETVEHVLLGDIDGAIYEENPERYIEDVDNAIAVRQAMEKMKPEYAMVIYLEHWHGYNDVEIAEYMGLSNQGVQYIRTRAVKKLKRLLSK